MSSERIEKLEILVTEHERTIEELSNQITEHWATIARLEKTLAADDILIIIALVGHSQQYKQVMHY